MAGREPYSGVTRRHGGTNGPDVYIPQASTAAREARTPTPPLTLPWSPPTRAHGGSRHHLPFVPWMTGAVFVGTGVVAILAGVALVVAAEVQHGPVVPGPAVPYTPTVLRYVSSVVVNARTEAARRAAEGAWPCVDPPSGFADETVSSTPALRADAAGNACAYVVHVYARDDCAMETCNACNASAAFEVAAWRYVGADGLPHCVPPFTALPTQDPPVAAERGRLLVGGCTAAFAGMLLGLHGVYVRIRAQAALEASERARAVHDRLRRRHHSLAYPGFTDCEDAEYDYGGGASPDTDDTLVSVTIEED